MVGQFVPGMEIRALSLHYKCDYRWILRTLILHEMKVFIYLERIHPQGSTIAINDWLELSMVELKPVAFNSQKTSLRDGLLYLSELKATTGELYKYDYVRRELADINQLFISYSDVKRLHELIANLYPTKQPETVKNEPTSTPVKKARPSSEVTEARVLQVTQRFLKNLPVQKRNDLVRAGKWSLKAIGESILDPKNSNVIEDEDHEFIAKLSSGTISNILAERKEELPQTST